MNKFPQTINEECFEATFNGTVPPALFEYGLRVQQRGVHSSQGSLNKGHWR